MGCVNGAYTVPTLIIFTTQALNWSEVGFTIIFGIEACLKIFAFTFNKYIRDLTNQVCWGYQGA